MKFPSKFISYKQSSISRFPLFLDALQPCDLSVNELYKKMKSSTKNIQDFIEILDCLYMLGRVELKNGVIHYVEND